MNADNELWKSCGVLGVDHVAVTTRNLVSVIKDYLSIPGSELLRGPGSNSTQNVDFAFVHLPGGMVVEILGVKDGSPISEHVEKGGGAYHLCFTVADMNSAIDAAIKNGAIMVVKPRKDDVFHPRKVAFLMHPLHGLFEFLEAYPSEIKVDVDGPVSLEPRFVSTVANQNASGYECVNTAFRNIFSHLDKKENIENAEYNKMDEWDSFKHLLLVMEIEKLAGVKFTADDISDSSSFSSMLKIVNDKLEKS